MRQGDYINVYFKYDQIVEGYEVIAKWKAFDPKCETGYLLMNFYNTRTGRNFQYISEKYSNYHTRELAYLGSFNGFQEGDIFHFDIFTLKIIENIKLFNWVTTLHSNSWILILMESKNCW